MSQKLSSVLSLQSNLRSQRLEKAMQDPSSQVNSPGTQGERVPSESPDRVVEAEWRQRSHGGVGDGVVPHPRVLHLPHPVFPVAAEGHWQGNQVEVLPAVVWQAAQLCFLQSVSKSPESRNKIQF
ncbi:hypothetical protein E2C01_069820 [Portunus trituberculatus]|uniref:Uncharacterized protein n=1 Tax=Portunus trituberculatus TaxID=210409 RepID=A0A5B7HVK4_PORTR|nr:hypothetical protein [Portunus trituberculatus]